MPKRVLGDDPFAAPPSPATPAAEGTPPRPAVRRRAGPGRAARARGPAGDAVARPPRAGTVVPRAPSPASSGPQPGAAASPAPGPGSASPAGGTPHGTPGPAQRPTDEVRALEPLAHDRLPAPQRPWRRPWGWLGDAWRRLALRGRSEAVDDLGLDPVQAARWDAILERLYRRRFCIAASGLEHVPAVGPAILAAHRSGLAPLDWAMILTAVRLEHPTHRRVRPLLEDELALAPTLGTIANRIGAVRACPENAERLLARGELVAVFPEGPRVPAGSWYERHRPQRPYWRELARQALSLRAPIVPCAVVEAERTHPVLARLRWPRLGGVPFRPLTATLPWLRLLGLATASARWTIRFGPPIVPPAEPPAAADRARVAELAETASSALQRMLDEDRSSRRPRSFR